MMKTGVTLKYDSSFVALICFFFVFLQQYNYYMK